MDNTLEEIVLLKHHAVSFAALSGMYSVDAAQGAIAEIAKAITSANSDEENTFLNAAIDLLKSVVDDAELEARETAEYLSTMKEEDREIFKEACCIGKGIGYDCDD